MLPPARPSLSLSATVTRRLYGERAHCIGFSLALLASFFLLRLVGRAKRHWHQCLHNDQAASRPRNLDFGWAALPHRHTCWRPALTREELRCPTDQWRMRTTLGTMLQQVQQALAQLVRVLYRSAVCDTKTCNDVHLCRSNCGAVTLLEPAMSSKPAPCHHSALASGNTTEQAELPIPAVVNRRDRDHTCFLARPMAACPSPTPLSAFPGSNPFLPCSPPSRRRPTLR